MKTESFSAKIFGDSQMIRILDAFYDGVAILDGDLNILYVNEALKKITGLTNADCSKDIYRVTTIKGIELEASAAFNALKTKCRYTTMRQRRHGGRILISCTPILNVQNDVTHLVINVRNLTGLNYLGYEVEKRQSRTPMTYDHFKLQEIRRQLDGAGFADFVVASPPMLELMESIIRLARYDTTVLIEGETGVGKTHVARIIHEFSGRKKDAFVDINVGSIPASLFESTFFGYERGAFSGGDKVGKVGIAGAAEGGTLFLDEIETLPLEIQGKILKLIDEKRYTKVGGSKVLTADIKLIAGSNVSLRQLTAEGKFRADLFYRLDELNFVVPPLRERKEEIPLLVDRIQDRLFKKYGFRKEIEKDAIDLLLGYDFKGNIRELNHVIEKAYVQDSFFLINQNVLGKYLRAGGGEIASGRGTEKTGETPNPQAVAARHDAESAGQSIAVPGNGLKAIKDKVKQKELQTLLTLYYKYGSTHKVARELGMSQPTVWRKLRAHINKKGLLPLGDQSN